MKKLILLMVVFAISGCSIKTYDGVTVFRLSDGIYKTMDKVPPTEEEERAHARKTKEKNREKRARREAERENAKTALNQDNYPVLKRKRPIDKSCPLPTPSNKEVAECQAWCSSGEGPSGGSGITACAESCRHPLVRKVGENTLI